jgi:hypothetical protein
MAGVLLLWQIKAPKDPSSAPRICVYSFLTPTLLVSEVTPPEGADQRARCRARRTHWLYLQQCSKSALQAVAA